MLIPRVMNGLEKSITFSLSEVMVKAATARSAFCRIKKIGMEIVAEVNAIATWASNCAKMGTLDAAAGR